MGTMTTEERTIAAMQHTATAVDALAVAIDQKAKPRVVVIRIDTLIDALLEMRLALKGER